MSEALDLARVRHDNALRLFDEFVHANVRSADAATLRGLERRFAERLQIQPSYWSQIKARSRQIGERLARQFEQLCRKPAGWMDQPHGASVTPPRGGEGASATLGGALGGALRADLASGHPAAIAPGRSAAVPSAAAIGDPSSQPLDDDERFIVGLVLTYYRRHPQRARARLLDLLGEVLTPPGTSAGLVAGKAPPPAGAKAAPAARPGAQPTAATPTPDDDLSLWQRTQAGVAPLPRKR